MLSRRVEAGEDSIDSLSSFEVPEQLEESSIADDAPRQYDSASLPAVITYQVIEDGSQKGKEKLADSLGYTYTQLKCGGPTAIKFGGAA